MKYKAHGAQEPRQCKQYGEVTSAAQRSNSPAQPLVQWLLRALPSQAKVANNRSPFLQGND